MLQRHSPQSKQRVFTASEVAEFEYCPLVWWHEQYEPAAQADTEELFARLVELEHDHGAQAPSLPEYQMIEQLLVRQGAFEEGRQQHAEHAEDVADEQESRAERLIAIRTLGNTRLIGWVALAILIIAIVCILIGIVFH